MTVPVRPSRAGVNGERAVLRIADHRAVVSRGAAVGQGQRRRVEPVDREQREVVAGVVVDGGGVERRAAVEADGRVVLAGDHVGVGDHEARRRRPSPSPRRRGRRRCRARARSSRRPPATSGRRRCRRRGGRHVGVRPAHGGRRVDAAEDVEQRSRRRQRVVERAEDRRALHRLAQLARLVAGGVQGDGAEPPADEQRERGEQERAADAVERRPTLPRLPRAEPPREPVERDREEGPDEQPGAITRPAARSATRRRRQQRRPDSGAERGAADEAGQRQRARDQAAL